MEQNVSTDKNFLRNILVTRGDPFVCACPHLRSSRCRQTIGESFSLYFWSIWEQHVFFLIIVHSRMKIYEVLKRASVHLPVLAHYSTGITSLSMKGMQRRFCCKVFSGKQRRKNAVGFATEVVDSLLWVERHPGTVTGLPPKERLQKRIHLKIWTDYLPLL